MQSREKRVEVLALSPIDRIQSARVGRVIDFQLGVVRVDYEGNARGPLVARVSTALEDRTLQRAARENQEALLLFEDSDPTKPVVVTLLRSRTSLVEQLLTPQLTNDEQVARIEAKRVFIEGGDEVVLRSGKATLTLKRDGRVVLRGINVVTQGDQVHKVRGGKVQIN